MIANRQTKQMNIFFCECILIPLDNLKKKKLHINSSSFMIKYSVLFIPLK